MYVLQRQSILSSLCGEGGLRMNTKNVVVAILGTIVKVALTVFVVMFVYKAAVKAYDFGYSIFEDKPMSVAPGREVTVSITSGKSVKEIGEILESKGLVEDATVFYFQNLLSSHKDELQPGMYTLNTSMTPTEIMEIMSMDEEITEE